MNQNRQFLYLQQSSTDAIMNVKDRLSKYGLQVIQTFDLHETGKVETACTCPNHGTEQCDCQLVVLLVYGKGNQPASLVVHGHKGQTWLSLVEFLGVTNTRLEAQICKILTLTETDLAA